MPTKPKIAAVLARLQDLSLANAPAPESLPSTLEGWSWILADLSDEELLRAVQVHLSDPERGRWWPTPADLLRGRPAPRSERDQDADAWDAILAHLARHGIAPGLREQLTTTQLQALHDGGGLHTLSQASGAGLTSLRSAYLDRCARLRATRFAELHTAPLQLGAPTEAAPALRLLEGGDPAPLARPAWRKAVDRG